MKQHDVKQDEAFVKELDTPEEVQADGELDEDALEDVAGGYYDPTATIGGLTGKELMEMALNDPEKAKKFVQGLGWNC